MKRKADIDLYDIVKSCINQVAPYLVQYGINLEAQRGNKLYNDIKKPASSLLKEGNPRGGEIMRAIRTYKEAIY